MVFPNEKESSSAVSSYYSLTYINVNVKTNK